MAVSTKKTKPSSPDISSGLSMLNSNPFNSSFESESSAPVSISNQQIQSGANTENSDLKNISTKNTQIIFRTTEETKNSLKGFFATYGYTLSKGIQMACFYLEQEIKAGNITMSPAGIIKKDK
ncbi:MAG: hypothetical protein SOZ24_03980 [Treponema sp.]|nr:hypothetical protein [Spirochaetia bacterium]MDY3886393.1 hypothetical protein [Treponema sp.]